MRGAGECLRMFSVVVSGFEVLFSVTSSSECNDEF